MHKIIVSVNADFLFNTVDKLAIENEIIQKDKSIKFSSSEELGDFIEELFSTLGIDLD